ncbi:MAG: lysophospholipid acyltransferase family protein [Dongiaceae bacterium]
MAALRSLLFNIGFFAWTALIVVAGVPVLLLPHRFTYRLGAVWVRGTLALLALLVGLRHRVVGLENRLPGAAIYAVKHQSTWDTLVFALLLDEPAYVLKRELMLVPFFGWLLGRAGMIPVDRAGKASALRRMMAAARAIAAAGRPLLIYPEGTRTAPGERRPYQPGVAALYGQLGLPVVPVAVNSGLFWGRRQFVKRPGTITVEFLPAIPPGRPRKAFMAELEDRLETACDRLATQG